MHKRLQTSSWVYGLIIAAFLAGFFLYVFLLDFEPADDINILHTVKTQTVGEIFTTSIFGRGEYYRPLLMLTAKALLTPSLSPVPFRGVLVLMGLLTIGLVFWCVRSQRVGMLPLAFAALILIASPITSGAFIWWADLGSRYAMIAFLLCAFFVLQRKDLPWTVAVPSLIVALLSQEMSLAIAFFCFCYALSRRQWTLSIVTVCIVALYFLVRFLVIGALFSAHPFVTLPVYFFGRTFTSADQMYAAFGRPPLVQYLYNIAAQLCAVFTVQPVEGQFLFVPRSVFVSALQTLSSIILGLYLWIRRGRYPCPVWPLVLIIITNVVICYATVRLRTLSLSSLCWLILFCIAVDDLWRTGFGTKGVLKKCIQACVILLLVGWMGRAVLIIADLRDQVHEQGNIYRTQPPAWDVDSQTYEQVRAKYL